MIAIKTVGYALRVELMVARRSEDKIPVLLQANGARIPVDDGLDAHDVSTQLFLMRRRLAVCPF